MVDLDVTISVQKVRGFLTKTEWISIIVSLGLAGAIAAFAVIHNDQAAQISTANKLRNRCTTAECLDAAIWLIGNQNENIDPCEYFYDNACFNYSQRYPATTASGETSVLATMRETNRIRLHNTVSNPPASSQWGPLYQTAVRANTYYTACIDQYERMVTYSGSSNPLVKALNTQLGQSWWVADQSKIGSYNWETPLQAAAGELDLILFNMRPATAPGEKNKYLLEFLVDESPSFRWATNHANFKEQIAFQEIVTDLGLLLARDYGLDTSDNTVKNNINTFVSDVVSVTNRFEAEVHTGQQYGASESYRQVYSWADWKAAVGSGVDFDALVKKYTNGKFTPNSATKVIERANTKTFMYTREMLADINRFKSDANFNRKMNNYFTFRIAFFWLPDMSYEYNHLYRRYYTLAYGSQEFPADWETCLDLMTINMPKALSALYVSRYYSSDTETTVSRVSHMVNHSLYTEVDGLDWMDNPTKEIAKRKLRALQFKIGKPVNWTDDSAIAAEMERHYGKITLDPKDHMGNVKKLIPVQQDEIARKLNVGANPIDDWRVELWDTRVEYYDEWNEVLIPAGIIQEPLISPGYPAYMNFGGMGTWIASAVLAAIDEQGQLLDENNVVANWWSDATWNKYNERKSIMIDFYNYTTPDLIQRYINVTAYTWFGIRETGGIRQAYSAYQRYIDHNGIDEQALPSLSHGDINQNFYYAYAGSHCDKWTSETTYLNVAFLRTMPTFIHVDGGVSQSHNFDKAFMCSTESRMYVPDQYHVYIF